jgi:5-methylcytosine-specific restriction endonuclease McrA
MKKCCYCKNTLDFSLFGKNKTRKDGYQPMCKECKNKENRVYHSQHREQELVYSKKYFDVIGRFQKDKISAASAKRKAAKLQAIPDWLSEFDLVAIQCKYSVSKMLTKHGYEKYAVDHIVPLQGKTVCGLHVPWNLQVITASENSKKGNRFNGEKLTAAL